MKNPLQKRLKQLKEKYEDLEVRAMTDEELLESCRELTEKYAATHGCTYDEAYERMWKGSQWLQQRH